MLEKLFEPLDQKNLRKVCWIVFFSVLIFKLILLYIMDAKLASDSKVFIFDAKNCLFMDNKPADCHQYYYYFYVFLIKISDLFTHSFLPVFLLQIFVSTISIVLLFKLSIGLNNSKMNLLIPVMCVTNYEISVWDSFLLTDSINLSLMLIAVYFLQKIINIDNNNSKFSREMFSLPNLSNYFIFYFICFLLPFTRPTYILFLPILIFFYLIHLRGKNIVLFWIHLLIIISLPILLHEKAHDIYLEVKDFQFFPLFKSGRVIFDRPSYNVRPLLDLSSATKTDMAFFLAKVYFKRAFYFWNIYVDDHSLSHKLYNLLYFVPFYTMSIIGILIFIIKSPNIAAPKRLITFLTISFVVANWCCGIFIQIDYDFRYRMIVFPFIAVWMVFFFDFISTQLIKIQVQGTFRKFHKNFRWVSVRFFLSKNMHHRFYDIVSKKDLG